MLLIFFFGRRLLGVSGLARFTIGRGGSGGAVLDVRRGGFSTLRARRAS